MDTEQTCQLFTQSQLQCLILEADREAESLRADKYRKILATVMGEERPGGAESQAARALPTSRYTLVRSSVAYCRPSYVPTKRPKVEAPQPTSDPVELTTTPRPSTNPSVVDKKRRKGSSYFAQNPMQVSKRARLALNISYANRYVILPLDSQHTRPFTRGLCFL
jgi:hypothetical protein